MKASRFSDAQRAFILKQGADGVPVVDICRKAGISQATYFNWKKKSTMAYCQRRCGG
jgi:putative transposase